MCTKIQYESFHIKDGFIPEENLINGVKIKLLLTRYKNINFSGSLVKTWFCQMHTAD